MSAKILAAIHQVMSQVGYVQKLGKNKFQDYKYAGEGHLLAALRPAMVEAGLILIPSHKSVSAIDEYGITTVCVEYTLAHKDGDIWPEKLLAYGTGGDKNSKGVGDKGLYKALTGANKYFLFKTFQLETGDDPEKDSEHDKPAKSFVERMPGGDKPDPKPVAGISSMRTQVNEAVANIESATDWETVDGYLNQADTKKLFLKVARDYETLWRGDETGSGLAGSLEVWGVLMKRADDVAAYIAKVETAAKGVK